jgi:hypothetical protein
MLAACGDDKECSTDKDCKLGQRCFNQRCENYNPAETDGLDGVDLPEEILNCEGAPPVGGDLFINEVHSAPKSGVDDSNCDGVSVSDQEEFVEIVNASDHVVSLSGVGVAVNGTVKTTLVGCLQPGNGMVVYGGGSPNCSMGSSFALVSSKTLSISNSGAQVSIQFQGADLDSVNTPSLSGVSYTRSPDFTGEFVKHDEVSPLKFSPGTCTGGAELVIGCTGEVIIEGDDTDIPDIVQCEGDTPILGDVLINEVLSAPKAGVDDTNCDGVVDSGQDEFVEVVNVSDKVIDLEGVEVFVNATSKTTLTGCLQPGSGLVLYGGGTPMCSLGSTQSLVSAKALQLSNSGTSVSLQLDGEILDTANVPSLSGVSYTRSPDFTGSFAKHNEVSIYNWSAGKCTNGGELLIGCPNTPPIDGDDITDTDTEVTPPCNITPIAGELLINELFTAPTSGVDDSNCDGTPNNLQDEYVELVNPTDKVLSLAGVEVLVGGNVKASLSGCLDPGRGLIVYSGGTASCTNLGGTQAFVAQSSLSLSNTSATVALVVGGTTLDTVTTPSLSGTSWTRNPDFTGTVFAKHSDVSSERFSAGLCIGGGELLLGCAGAASCDDLAQNGEETDVDCGGPVCPACAATLACLLPRDCLSGSCVANVCSAPAGCNDGSQNGDETDVDCGGSCSPCINGRHCVSNGDCQSSYCLSLVCADPPPKARLRFNEVNAHISGGCDLIELRVTQAGTLSGYSIKERTKTILTFGDLTVNTNDYIIVHAMGSGCNASASPNESSAKAEAPRSTHAQNYDTAYDWYATSSYSSSASTGLTDTDNVFTLLDDTGTILDALLASDDETGNAAGDSESAAAAVVAQNQWTRIDGSVPAGGFVDAEFSVAAAQDLNATGTAVDGESIQRNGNQDANHRGDWTQAASSWGANNAGQSDL